MLKFCAVASALSIAVMLPLVGAHAQTTYTDNASNYTGNYAGVAHAGYGAFTVTAVNGANGTAPYSGTFIGSASASEGNNGTPSPSSIDTAGNSFGFYANSAPSASVTINRNFTTSLTKANDAFSLDFVGGYNDGGSVGVSLLNNQGQNVATFFYDGTNGNYTFNSATTNGPAPGAGPAIATFASGAVHLSYTLLSPTSVRLAITGAISPATQTASFVGPLTGFSIFQTGTTGTNGGDAAHNGYFNNISETIAPGGSATPEPADIALMMAGIGIIGVVGRRFSRR